jgi:hypothetical protein
MVVAALLRQSIASERQIKEEAVSSIHGMKS